MKIYIDSEFHCHTSNDGAMREVDCEFFNNKCDEFVEGYMFIPSGESFGEFTGEMIAPWKPYEELAQAQAEYEHEQVTEMTEALRILGVTV